ncbi:hypothetical protein DKX38_016460 [Salix brachista]|uniref:Transcription initiation factor IIF subunit beta n=1 Tax=Salix brachista TaxID=2182728 RepID=A0A5N5L819_9ROSI|nr:hypothetical protein DKX38_016460 [Salix brachista]
MDDEASSSGNNNNNKNLIIDNNNKSPVLGGFLDASKAEKSVWLMKCPSMVSRFLRSQEHEGGDGDASSPPVAKVIVSVDPLKGNDDDNSATEGLVCVVFVNGDIVLQDYPNAFDFEFPFSGIEFSLLDWLVGIGGKVSNNFVRGSFLRKYISVRMEIFELLFTITTMSGGEGTCWIVEILYVCIRTNLHGTKLDDNELLGTVFALVSVILFLGLSEDVTFTMEMAGTEPGDGLKTYSMEMSKDLVDMSVFSESSQGKMSVEGRILNKFDVRPHSENLENYRKICRERTKKYMIKSRQIKVIDNDTGSHMMPMPGMIISGLADKRKLPIKASDMKRTRRDRREMEGIMFKLFEKQPNWTLRQLIQETDQPEYRSILSSPSLSQHYPVFLQQFVKDMLKDLCVYNNKGSNQGSYQLKPEYKKSNEEPSPE